jgi:hypothetical protein
VDTIFAFTKMRQSLGDAVAALGADPAVSSRVSLPAGVCPCSAHNEKSRYDNRCGHAIIAIGRRPAR